MKAQTRVLACYSLWGQHTTKIPFPLSKSRTFCPQYQVHGETKSRKGSNLWEGPNTCQHLDSFGSEWNQPRAPRSHCLHHYLPPCLLLCLRPCLRQMVAGSGIAPSHLRCLPACLPHRVFVWRRKHISSHRESLHSTANCKQILLHLFTSSCNSPSAQKWYVWI